MVLRATKKSKSVLLYMSIIISLVLYYDVSDYQREFHQTSYIIYFSSSPPVLRSLPSCISYSGFFGRGAKPKAENPDAHPRLAHTKSLRSEMCIRDKHIFFLHFVGGWARWVGSLVWMAGWLAGETEN